MSYSILLYMQAIVLQSHTLATQSYSILLHMQAIVLQS